MKISLRNNFLGKKRALHNCSNHAGRMNIYVKLTHCAEIRRVYALSFTPQEMGLGYFYETKHPRPISYYVSTLLENRSA